MKSEIPVAALQAVAVRLLPDEELSQGIQRIAAELNISAGCIISCCGSLKEVALRMAGGNDVVRLTGPHEIVFLSGTLEPSGQHLHLAVSNPLGEMTGGHVLPGCVVNTTCELIIGILPGISFRRKMDPATGFRELIVR